MFFIQKDCGRAWSNTNSMPVPGFSAGRFISPVARSAGSSAISTANGTSRVPTISVARWSRHTGVEATSADAGATPDSSAAIAAGSAVRTRKRFNRYYLRASWGKLAAARNASCLSSRARSGTRRFQ